MKNSAWLKTCLVAALCLPGAQWACKSGDKAPAPPRKAAMPESAVATKAEKASTEQPPIQLISPGRSRISLELKFPDKTDIQAAADTLRKRLTTAGAKEPRVEVKPPRVLSVTVKDVASPDVVHLVAGFQGKLEVLPVDEKSRILELAHAELDGTERLKIGLIQHAGQSAMLDSREPPYLIKIAQRIASKVTAKDRAIGIQQQGKRAFAMVLVTRLILNNSDVERMSIAKDPDGRYRTVLHLGEAGAKRLADYTAAHVGERLAVVLDDNILLAPTIRERIGNGRIAVSSHFSEDAGRALMQARVQGFLISMDPLPARPEITLIEKR